MLVYVCMLLQRHRMLVVVKWQMLKEIVPLHFAAQ